MEKNFKWKVLLIIAVTAFCLWKVYPPQQKIKLGLDLRGGMQLVLKVDLEKIPENARNDASERVVEIIRNRIDELGVTEPVITRQGVDQVVVQLPGVTDREHAKAIVGKTAHLEFKMVSEDSALLTQAEAGTVPEGYEYLEMQQDNLGSRKILVESKAALTGDHLTTASIGFDQYGQAIVQLQFDDEGAKIFDRTTFQNIGRQMAIVLDGKAHSAPVIRDRIPNGQAQISGGFTPDQASDLALVLRAGSLPAPVTIIEERTVGASLGRDSIQKGVRAGFLGTLMVVIFMPCYYLLAGLVANIGLAVYCLMTIGFLAALNAALTLPGIAGFILSIGMAVDANVLIFERMREELATGKTPRGAVSAGYHRAFSAILDSHVTTFLTSVLLFMFGTGPVKGFAVTLSIGIVASMFSAIVVTRVVMDFLLKNNPNLNLKMFHLFGKTNFQFLKGRLFAYGFSAVVLGVGLAAILVRGHSNYGVEFTGGMLAQVQFQKTVAISDLRRGLDEVGSKGATIQNFGTAEENQFIIKTADSDTHHVETVAAKLAGGEEGYKLLRVERIGPSVSKDLTQKAISAVLWAALGILVYLAWRFEWQFALAAVIALFHDTLFSFGIYALVGREINLTAIAAVLTIMGFSVSDTIITFDRVRENLKIHRKKPFSEVVTLSINETLSRTIITTLTVLFSSLALFLFGGEAINDFAFILLVGFIVGIYSTVFVATSLVVDWKGKGKGR